MADKPVQAGGSSHENGTFMDPNRDDGLVVEAVAGEGKFGFVADDGEIGFDGHVHVVNTPVHVSQ